MPTTPVYLEEGRTKVFASSLAWPGWSRSGRHGEEALERLADYAPRYAPVAARAGLRFPARPALEVVERVAGNATTDFGAPAVPAAADLQPVSAAAARRMAALVEASWATLAEVAAGAPPSLRKGPRGGGRDRDAMVAHVEEAEHAYARKMGVRHRPAHGDPALVAARRGDILAALRAARGGAPPDGNWPLPYAARRIAWHALDHAWEMEDRSAPQ